MKDIKERSMQAPTMTNRAVAAVKWLFILPLMLVLVLYSILETVPAQLLSPGAAEALESFVSASRPIVVTSVTAVMSWGILVVPALCIGAALFDIIMTFKTKGEQA